MHHDMLQVTWVEKLERLYDIAVMVASAHDVEEALQTIVDSARELAGAQYAALGVPGKRGEPMWHFATSGLPAEVAISVEHPPIGRGVLGLMLNQGASVRLPDVQTHPAYQGTPHAHPEIHSFLGVPIQSGGQVIGDLYIANKIGADQFTEEDQRLVEMLASHAAVVVQTLHAQQRERELALLRQREQIARELQDDVLQSLYGVGLLLGHLDTHDPARMEQDIAAIRETFDDAIERLRQHLLSLTHA